jgi:hypothetical protein
VSETKHVQFGEARRRKRDNVVRKLAAGRKTAVEAPLERRPSYRDERKVHWPPTPVLARKGGPESVTQALPAYEKIFSKSFPVPRRAIASNVRPESIPLGPIPNVGRP